MNVFNSRLSDKFSGHLKTTICCFLTVSLAAALWLALLCFEIAQFSKLSVYIASITCMVSLRCIIALFYELLMEVHYPTPESLASLTWGQVQLFSYITHLIIQWYSILDRASVFYNFSGHVQLRKCWHTPWLHLDELLPGHLHCPPPPLPPPCQGGVQEVWPW